MRTQANKKRRLPDFDIGDRVFIIKKAWSTTRPSDKLDYVLTRNYYRIKAKVKDNAFELDMPLSWRASSKFNADRLRKYNDNPLPG
jgi:hypothetical protein